MTASAVFFMIVGLCITWGGLALAVRTQFKASKKEKNN